MKRLAAVTLLIALLLSLAACGGNPEPGPAVTPPSSAQPTPTPEATPEPTPTPEATPAPEATPEPTPEATPEPTPEATPEPTPTPEATPEPTPEVTPEPTPPVVQTDKLAYMDGIYMEYGEALDENSLTRFADKLVSLRDSYFPDSPVYYAIVPDKSWYGRSEAQPYYDHAAIVSKLADALPELTGIDLTAALSLTDYYATDPHWRQEELFPVVEALGAAMDFSVDADSFTVHSLPGFVGTYGKEVEGLPSETLHYLSSEYTDAAVVENFQQPDFKEVYDTAKFDANGYDLFLSGATPLTVITNPKAASQRELVIFRDSFGGAIAPLMLEAYSKITLVDIRYMVSMLLPQYVDFTNAEVLFLYCDELVNKSLLLK